jgi:hypothetical protein
MMHMKLAPAMLGTGQSYDAYLVWGPVSGYDALSQDCFFRMHRHLVVRLLGICMPKKLNPTNLPDALQDRL